MDTVFSQLVLIILLLVANAFFVAAEFALVKVRYSRVEILASVGGYLAVLTLKIKNNLEAYLAACQLGITMASLGLGWVGEPFVALLLKPVLIGFDFSPESIHTISFLLGFIIFSSLHIVVGEQVPKTYAIRRPEPVSLWVAFPLHLFYLFAWPLNTLLNLSSRFFLKLLDVKEAGHEDIFSGEEISDIITTSQEHGHIEQDRAQMLRNMFAFDRRTAREVMAPRNHANIINIDHDPDAIKAFVGKTGHSRYPVVQGNADNPIGLLLLKDIFSTQLTDSGDAVWENLVDLVRETLMVPEHIGIGPLFEKMKNERSHMALVIDEYGAFSGIVTMEDLLEEIVGEIDDEQDSAPTAPVLIEIDDGWQTTGLAPLHDIDKFFGTHFSDSVEAATLSGLMMKHLNRMPQEGDIVEEGDYVFTIQSIVGRRVGDVIIRKNEIEENGSKIKP
jgi:CBS domain containing-hemolysin-like protein